MGYLTRKQIVTRGLQQAGVPLTLERRMNERLNSWLRSQYAAMDWPYLSRRETAISFPTGTTSLAFGAGNNGVTEWVRRVVDPIVVYSSNFTVRVKMRVSTVFDGALQDDDIINNPANHRGIPSRCKVKPHESTQGAFNIIPNVFPDRDLLLAIDYIVIPNDIDETSAGDSVQPLYPNDRTLIEAVRYLALDYDKKPEAVQAMEIVGGMVSDDKLKFGALPGINQTWGLDPKVFRR